MSKEQRLPDIEHPTSNIQHPTPGQSARSIRAFIALEISDEARGEVARLEKELKISGADVKWVMPESMHLTLKFLGNIPEEKIPVLSRRLDEITSVNAPFEATLHDLGVFPKWDHPRVVWVGLFEGADRVTAIAAQVEEAMAGEGFAKEERKFSPHITIGRVRTTKNKDKLKRIAEGIAVKPVTSRISGIILFRSELSSAGSVYTPLHVAEFKG